MIPDLMHFVKESTKETTPTQEQNLIQCLLRNFRILLKPYDDDFGDQKLNAADKKESEPRIDNSFLYSVVWSICCTCTGDYRVQVNQKFKKILLGDVEKGVKIQNKKFNFPDRQSIYDYCYFPITNTWKNWHDFIEPKDLDFPKNMQPQDIIVTTVDKVRYQYILETNIKNKIPTLFVGPTGTGKSIYIKNIINDKLAKDKYEIT